MSNNTLITPGSTLSISKNLLKSVLEQKSSPKSQPYHQLFVFKNQIEVHRNCPSQTPYTSEKSKVLFYKALFLGIGLLYGILTLILYFKTVNWNYELIFGNGAVLKSAVCSLCAFSSAASFGIGLFINAKEESVRRIYREAKARTLTLYERKKIKHGINNILNIGEKYRVFFDIRHNYRDTLEKLHEQREQAMHLMERISSSKSLTRNEREELYNQATLEFRDNLEKHILAFKNS